VRVLRGRVSDVDALAVGAPLGRRSPVRGPLGALIFASIFVYRHTPRRRALQAASAAVLASLLTLAAFTLASVLSGRPALEPFPALPYKNA